MRSTRFRLHVGIEGGTEGGGGEGEKGAEGGKVAVRVSDAFLLVGFPSLPFGATLIRRASMSPHSSKIQVTRSSTILDCLMSRYPLFRPRQQAASSSSEGRSSWSHNQALSG